jgi:hypothetical protein
MAIACAVMALVAIAWAPRQPRLALGVVAGGLLVGMALWALSGLVDALGGGSENGKKRPVSRAFSLVKFFTRHVILAAVAYVMMVRLHLDPVGMVVGVTSVVVAAALEATRPR